MLSLVPPVWILTALIGGFWATGLAVVNAPRFGRFVANLGLAVIGAAVLNLGAALAGVQVIMIGDVHALAESFGAVAAIAVVRRMHA